MRWTRREAGQKPSAAPVIEDVPFFTQGQRPDSLLPASAPTGNNIEQLQKAERVLGISHRQSSLVTPSNARQRGPQPVVSPQEPTGSDRWATQSEQEGEPMDNARSANGGLKPWPSLQSTNNHASMHDMHASGPGWSSSAHYASNKPSHQHQIPRQPSNSTLRSHYEASQPPFATLQQTNSATGRTMGLRKAKSGVAFSGDDVETSGRPLKSALKQPSHEHVRIEKPANKKDSSWMPKFGSIFAKQQPADRGLLQPHQIARAGSSLSVASHSQSYAAAPSSNHNNEALHSPAPGSVSADPTTRPKVFESDVYDSAKVHVRRPPKGIQNWFDGVDVSSDDDDQIPSEALPSIFSPYEDKQLHAAPQNPRPHTGDRRKEDHGRKGHRESQSRRSSRQPSRPEQNRPRNISDTFVEENAMAIDLARQRMQENRRQPQHIPQGRRNSGHSLAPSSFSHAQSIMTGAHPRPADYGGPKREPDDRTGRSRVPVESVRSMSVYSEYEPQPSHRHDNMPASSSYKGHITEASPSSRRQSSNAARPSMVKRSNTRDTVMTTQTSGSIPIHWSFDDPMPALPTRAAEDTSKVDHTSEALRRLIGRDNSVRNRSSRAASSRYTYEDSVGGDTNDSHPSDISRMMAVTEEEMALLEMMRLKRAAMQKGDISEGAQQILDRDHQSQKSAGKPAHDLAKAKDERAASRNDDWAHDLRPNYDRIAGLGSLLEEDADEKLRIERFLASQTPLEDVFPFPSPPPRSRESSIPHEFAQMEDLLLPRTYTPQPPEPRPQQEQEKPAKRVPKAPSTVSGASEFDADESAQLEAEMRQFLGEDGFSDSSAFPLPPKSSISSRRASRRAPRANGMLAPVLPSTREEETTPPIPNRSPNRIQSFNDESVLPPSDRTMHLRADSQALRAFPPTINTKFSARRPEPPTPSDIGSERLSVLLGPSFEQSLDLTFPPSAGTSASQNSNMRYDSPSICTSQASPLTPTFPTSLASADKHRGGVEIASSDTASGYPATYDAADQSSLRTSSSTKSGAHSQKSSRHKQSKALAPEPLALLTPATYNGRSPSRVSSTGSCMSASDDVLAAWAELGGVSDGLSIRSR